MQHAVGALFSSASRALLSARRIGDSELHRSLDARDARDVDDDDHHHACITHSPARSHSPLKRLKTWLTPSRAMKRARDEDDGIDRESELERRAASERAFTAEENALIDAASTKAVKRRRRGTHAGDRATGADSASDVAKAIDFELERSSARATREATRERAKEVASTSARESDERTNARMTPTRRHNGKENVECGGSPFIGGGVASPLIVARVGDVLANLDVDSDVGNATEEEEVEEEGGATQAYDDDADDYVGGTQVMDSAELCEAPTRLDLAIAPKIEEPEIPCTRGGDAVIRLLRRRLFGVNRERPVDSDGLDFAANLKAHRDHLLSMLEDTVSGGQNNSVLLVGNRGSGKTLILDSALKMLENRHPGKVVTVYLNGLLHADERVGMQKIATQLCPNLNEDAGGRSGGGFAENVAFMTEMLKLLQGGRRGVIFVLDEFELFAMRSKQTLLYAITDLLQQPHVQAAVVGVTCRHSIDRLLEKRVASRFSNRRIVVAPPGSTVSMVDGVTKALKLTDKDTYMCPSEPDFVQQWNLSLRAAMLNVEVKDALEQFGRLENTPSSVSKMACAILSRINRSMGKITALDIVEAAKGLDRNPFVDSLIGVTPLELLLCVAMYRMHRARQRPSFTFDALAQELNEMGSQEQLTHAKDCGRSVLVRAFENLLTLGIATAHKSGSGVRGAALKEYKNIVFVVADEELREAIRRHPNAVSGLADYMEHENLRGAHTV